jgi:hypothetical protein
MSMTRADAFLVVGKDEIMGALEQMAGREAVVWFVPDEPQRAT